MLNAKNALAAVCLAMGVFSWASPVLAATPDEDDSDEVLEDVVVEGSLPRGAVRTPVAAESRVERAIIRAVGANNLDEVLDAFAPQARTMRGDGDPILLLNGRRIADRSQIDAIAPEAIRRLEIFPEEVALQYGYPPDRRVVNIILRRSYQAAELQANSDVALGAGRSTWRAKANLLQLTPEGRLNLDAGYREQQAVRDADAGSGTDARSRLPRAERTTVSATYARDADNLHWTASSDGQWRGEHWLLGRGTTGSATARNVDEFRGGAALAFNGESAGGWRWSLDGKLDLDDMRINTREGAMPATQTGSSIRSERREWAVDLAGSGSPGEVPGGSVDVAYSAGIELRRQVQRDLLATAAGLSTKQNAVHAGGSMDVPLLDARRLSVFGDGSVETSNREDLSGRFGGGLRSSPMQGLQLSASYSHARSLPDFDDLSAARVATPNVRVYDFSSGDARYVLEREGGNPALAPQSVRTLSMRAQLRPLAQKDLALSLDYSDMKIRQGASGTLGPTPQVEAAFPARFTRDVGGVLTAFDSTPVNIAHEHRRQLRGGINLAAPFGVDGSIPPATASGTQPKAVINQLQMALYHTWTIKDDATLRTGAPEIDLLDGAAIGNRGGTSRHLVEGQLGFATRRFGLRLAAQWRSRTRVEDQAGIAAHRLTIRPATTLDARMYLNLKLAGEALGMPWLKGRLNLSMDNLLGTRARIRDENGGKVEYYRGSQEDTGRTIRLSFRKLFRQD